MTRYRFEIGDPVYFIKDGEMIEGFILGKFIWQGIRHFVVGNEKEWTVQINPRPNKKSGPLCMPNSRGQ